MAGREFVVAKEWFYHNNRDNFTPRKRLNNWKQLFKCKLYIDQHFKFLELLIMKNSKGPLMN